MSEERLPPWPDELLFLGRKQAAISWLANLSLPGRNAAIHLNRWAKYVGATLTREDYNAVDPPRPVGEG